MKAAGFSERCAAILAFGLPFGLALVRTSSHAQWRGDVAALRDVLLVPMGGLSGGVSTALAQLFVALPLGSLTFRTALVSALAVGFIGLFLYGIANSLLAALDRVEAGSPDRPWFAVLASLLATLSPAFQREATVGGSTALALALSLFGLQHGVALLSGAERRRPMAGLSWAALAVGLAIAEQAAAGIAALVSLAVMVAMVRLGLSQGPRLLIPGRVVVKATLLAGLGLLVGLAPTLLRHLAEHPALPLGGAPSLRAIGLQLMLEPPLLEGLGRDLGLYAVALSVVGTVVLTLHPRARTIYAGLLAIVVADLAFRTKLGESEAMLGLRMLALASLCCASTAGLFFGTRFLAAMRMPAARGVAAMSVAFYATLVVLVAEHSAEQSDRQSDRGAERLTDLYLETAPPRAALLSNSSQLSLRLLAAQWVEGRRQDTLLISVPLLDRGGMARQLLAHEPAAELLLRAVALTGQGNEASLARLADARPLLVQYDRGFDGPTQRHLAPWGAWLQFHTDPPSRVDRQNAFAAAHAQLTPALAGLGPLADPASNGVWASIIRGQAKLALQARDHGTAERHLRTLHLPGERGASAEGSLDVLFLGAVARLGVVEKVQTQADKAQASRRR